MSSDIKTAHALILFIVSNVIYSLDEIMTIRIRFVFGMLDFMRLLEPKLNYLFFIYSFIYLFFVCEIQNSS